MKLLLLLLLSFSALAADTAGVVFPERWTLDKTELLKNGEGLREFGVMGLDIYAVALYLQKPERDARRVLDSSAPRVIHMQFFRGIGRDDLRKAWAYGFEQNCAPPCVLPQKELAAFQAFIPDWRRGDTETYEFYAEYMNLRSNGKLIGSVHGKDFVRLLLSTWIGDAPPTPELRAALLGL